MFYCPSMLNLKNLNCFFYNIMLITIKIMYIICSSNNFQKIELLKLTPENQIDLNKMLNELSPNFVFTTYLIDPNIINTCYIFIENNKTKEIKFYNFFLDNKQSLNLIKDKILFENLSINDLFDLNFKDISNIENEIEIYKNSSTIYDINNYNKFIKSLINKFYILLKKFDSYFINKVSLKSTYCRNSILITSLICRNLIEFIKLGNKLHKTNKSNSGLFLNSNKELETLEIYLSNKVIGLKNFILLDLNFKFDFINKLANCTYCFCLKRKILTEHIINYILAKIKMIINKLDKLTFLLCLIKIYGDVYNNNSKPRLLKLTIMICLYLHNINIEINNEETLIILYTICKKRIVKNEKYFKGSDLCVLDKRQKSTMKLVIIRRYSYFVIFYQNEFLNVLKNLEYLSDYFNFIWFIIKCSIVTIYNIFDIEII